MSVWFNTDIKEGKGNSLSITHDLPHSLMLSARLNNPEEIDSIPVPNDPKLKLFFWQVSQFLSNRKIGGGENTTSLYSKDRT